MLHPRCFPPLAGVRSCALGQGSNTPQRSRQVRGGMATGLELGLVRLRARRQQRGSDDGESSTEFASKLKRDREGFKRDHPLPPLPSGAADAASKRQHVAPPASPGRPPADTPAPPAPYELLVESPDGNVQSHIVDPALPLCDTVLYHELSPGAHLRLDGDRLDTAQSASGLGLSRGAVLQACLPQRGGGYEDGEDFEADREEERAMEAEQQRVLPRRRQRVVEESEDEDGATNNEGSGEGAPRRRRRRVVAPDSENDEPNAGGAAAPTSFECAVCASEKPMGSVVKVDGCKHPDDLVCGGCMFTEVCGNAASCPWCRAPASVLVQVATGRRYEVTDKTLSRVHTQGGELAEQGDPEACHTCRKFGFLFECDGCGQNRCFKCSGYDWPPEGSFFCETCEATPAANRGPRDASATQSDVGGVAMAEGGPAAGTVAAESEDDVSEDYESEDDESEDDESEGDESDDDESEGDADEDEADEAEGREEQEGAAGDEAMAEGGGIGAAQAREEQEGAAGGVAMGTAGGVAMAEGGGAGGAQEATPADEQQARQAQQARQSRAQEASERAANIQEQQRGSVDAPAIAESGMLPWDCVSVEVAQLEESKVLCDHLPAHTTAPRVAG